MMYFSDITFTRFCKDPSGKFLQAGNIWKYNPQDRRDHHFPQPLAACRTGSSSTATAT